MASWPPIAFEKHPWVSKFNPDQLTRRQAATYREPYSASVLPEIAKLPVAAEGGTAAEVDEASQSLVQFDTELGAMSTPFAAILLRSESASSSQIEQLTSGARAIAEAELGERESGNAALVVRNVRAMQAALALSDHIDHDGIIAMQHALLGAHAPELTGRYRDEQVWIGGDAIGPQAADFVPPHPDRVLAAMDDLLGFIARVDIPVLTQVAIAHAQFETIHPFPDGNGRTGRALVQAMMREKGLTTHVAVPVSAGLLHDVERYYGALGSYRKGDIEPIVSVFAAASLHAVSNGRKLASDIAATRARWVELMSGLRVDATARRVATLAVEQPVINQRLIVERLGVSAMSAYRALETLEQRGVLHSANSKKRNRIWIADDVIASLDDFAARAGRRGH
jgi:Fic family protein